MDNENTEYFNMSVRDSLALMLWTSIGTLLAVGAILALAL
jgi:hypothetical protein